MNLETTYNKYLELIKNDTFDYQKFNQFAIVHHSNSVEGSTLTKEETYLLLDENLTPKNKPLEFSLMAVDHLQALKFVIQLAEEKKQLTIDIIQQISALLLKSTGSKISSIAGDLDSSKGDFRLVTVRAGSTTFMDYKKVPQRVSELIEFINTEISKKSNFNEINELAFDAHFQIVSIHPFADGNGRISRLLMNYIQHFHKLPLSIVYAEDKQDYFSALQETRKIENIIHFRNFMFEQINKFLTEQIADLSKKQITKKSISGMKLLF
jgi:Fic family protein